MINYDCEFGTIAFSMYINGIIKNKPVCCDLIGHDNRVHIYPYSLSLLLMIISITYLTKFYIDFSKNVTI